MPAAAPSPAIELDNVSISFGDRHILEGLSLQIPSHETTVIVGSSGSGKTVLLKLMMGLLMPDRGHVRVLGQDLARASPVERLELHKRMAMLFQNYALFDALSIEDNVEFPLREGLHMSRRDAGTLAHELIRVLQLEGNEDVLPADLSGGMRKRVSLARALVGRPEIALLDEPTTGLDPLMVEQVDQIISGAKQRAPITTVVISHDLASIRRLADHVAFLHGGKIVFFGTYDEFIHSPLPAIRTFLGGEAQPRASSAPAPADRPVIELAGVWKQLGAKQVLRGIDLAIYPHRITALIGASGSGKSVLARHIMGFIKPDRGKVLVFGNDVSAMNERELAEMRSHIGFVFQHAALLDWVDVEGNVAFPLVEARREAAPVIHARVEDMLHRLGLADLRHRMPAQLSAGERKRVALARAMVMQPQILIYDEPTTGQDPLHSHEIDDMIVQTQEQFGITTIVISHDMVSTFRIAHTIAMIHDGTIAICGSPAEVAASRDAYVHRFLDASALE